MTTRKLIGRTPEFPTPWEATETTDNRHIIVSANGHYAAEVPDADLAGLIVRAVNRLSDAEESR